MEKEEYLILSFDPHEPVFQFRKTKEEAEEVYNDLLEIFDDGFVILTKVIKQEAPTDE